MESLQMVRVNQRVKTAMKAKKKGLLMSRLIQNLEHGNYYQITQMDDQGDCKYRDEAGVCRRKYSLFVGNKIKLNEGCGDNNSGEKND